MRPLLVPRQGSCGILQLGLFCSLLYFQSQEENAPMEFCFLGPAPAISPKQCQESGTCAFGSWGSAAEEELMGAEVTSADPSCTSTASSSLCRARPPSLPAQKPPPLPALKGSVSSACSCNHQKGILSLHPNSQKHSFSIFSEH